MEKSYPMRVVVVAMVVDITLVTTPLGANAVGLDVDSSPDGWSGVPEWVGDCPWGTHGSVRDKLKNLVDRSAGESGSRAR